MNTATTKRSYTKRYQRPAQPPNFELTERVIRINAEICRRPLIRKDQLQALFPDISSRPFDQIISHLFQNGFTARPRQQQETHRHVSGSLPTYLTPDRRGVQLHEAFFADPVPTPKYTQENDRGSWGYMRHQHTTTTTLLDYQHAAVNQTTATFLSEDKLWNSYAPAAALNQPAFKLDDYPRLMAHDFIANPPVRITKQKPKVPLQLKTRLDWAIRLPKIKADNEEDDHEESLTTVTHHVSTRPDGYFALQAADTKFFFLESDEGTETIEPGEHLRQSPQLFSETSLLAKYLVYFAAYRKRAQTKQFGISKFSVITVTSTARRKNEIIKKLSPYFLVDLKNINHRDLFLFTDRTTLAEHMNDPYHPDHHHKNFAGGNVRLLST